MGLEMDRMTTKRFTYYKCEILDDGKHFAYAYSEYNAEDICEKLNDLCEVLNELNDKNKELKEFIRNLTNFKGEILLRNGRAYKREYVERLLE